MRRKFQKEGLDKVLVSSERESGGGGGENQRIPEDGRLEWKPLQIIKVDSDNVTKKNKNKS